MFGDIENPGISILALDKICDHISKNNTIDFELCMSMLEIYNGEIRDLLNN